MGPGQINLRGPLLSIHTVQCTEDPIALWLRPGWPGCHCRAHDARVTALEPYHVKTLRSRTKDLEEPPSLSERQTAFIIWGNRKENLLCTQDGNSELAMAVSSVRDLSTVKTWFPSLPYYLIFTLFWGKYFGTPPKLSFMLLSKQVCYTLCDAGVKWMT